MLYKEPVYSEIFREKVENIIQKPITHQTRLGKRYFKRHPEKWVRLVNVIKLKDKELKLYLSVVKMQGE